MYGITEVFYSDSQLQFLLKVLCENLINACIGRKSPHSKEIPVSVLIFNGLEPLQKEKIRRFNVPRVKYFPISAKLSGT